MKIDIKWLSKTKRPLKGRTRIKNEMTHRRYRNGDLYLENTWTLDSILLHAEDPKSRWSNLGIVMVDDDYNADNDDGVAICFLCDGGLTIMPIDHVLRRPILQAAAIRSLDRQTVDKSEENSIVSYLKGFLNKVSPVAESSHALQTVIKNATRNLYDPINEEVKTRPPGFIKGQPKYVRQSVFTTQDLIISALSYAELTTYDPNLPLSDFQAGGILDDIYLEEVPLFPRPPHTEKGISVEESILIKAQKDVLAVMSMYYEAKPRMEYKNFQNFKPVLVNSSNGSNLQFQNSDEESDDEDDMMEARANYPEQMSNVDRTRRQGKTAEMAEEHRSKTQDKIIRRLHKQSKLYARPIPNYKK